MGVLLPYKRGTHQRRTKKKWLPTPLHTMMCIGKRKGLWRDGGKGGGREGGKGGGREGGKGGGREGGKGGGEEAGY